MVFVRLWEQNRLKTGEQRLFDCCESDLAAAVSVAQEAQAARRSERTPKP